EAVDADRRQETEPHRDAQDDARRPDERHPAEDTPPRLASGGTGWGAGELRREEADQGSPERDRADEHRQIDRVLHDRQREVEPGVLGDDGEERVDPEEGEADRGQRVEATPGPPRPDQHAAGPDAREQDRAGQREALAPQREQRERDRRSEQYLTE